MKIKSYFVKIKENIAKLYNKNKKLLIAIVALFVVLVGYFIFVLPENKTQKIETVEEDVQAKNLSSYEDMLEGKLEKMLLDIEGVSSVKVMVVCESSVVYHYLKNVSVTETTGGEGGNKTISEEVVYEKDGSNSKPILERYDTPKVLGVMVVINEVSPSTKLSITNSISIVLNIDASCISIVLD